MAAKHCVSIKGLKDRLVFLLDDQCDFSELLADLKYKLEFTHRQLLTGPIVHVDIKLGSRVIGESEKEAILGLLKQNGNLLIRSIESDTSTLKQSSNNQLQIITGILRSGQILHFNGTVLLLGDINPGGLISSTGDIYVMGNLRGMAHAGTDGDNGAIIAASYLSPMQLRISNIISRPPDEWSDSKYSMEFAYLEDGLMQIDKIANISKLRQDPIVFKGV